MAIRKEAGKQEYYSDLDLAFLPHPVTGKLAKKTNRNAVRQSVKSLILTNFYERPFRSNIGCNVRSMLFELFSPLTKQKLENAVRETIYNFEPRAEVIEVIAEQRDDLNALTLSIAFYVINDPEPVILDVILERIL